jgi:large repetitive protein
MLSARPRQPELNITKTHSGGFTQGQTNATYILTVANRALSATSGTVAVTETLPAGLTLVSMEGTGWNCSSASCTRTDSLASGARYPAITVTVNVASDAPSQVLSQVSVSGGGSAGASAADPTTVAPPL